MSQMFGLALLFSVASASALAVDARGDLESVDDHDVAALTLLQSGVQVRFNMSESNKIPHPLVMSDKGDSRVHVPACSESGLSGPVVGRAVAEVLPAKLHFLSMGRSGSCFLGELFGTKSSRPYVFEPFNREANGWGLWSPSAPTPPYNAGGVGWRDSAEEAEDGLLMRKLRCIYECQGCEKVVCKPSELPEFCNGGHDMVVVKTVALMNATTLLKLPQDALSGSKFVLLLRDPRGMENHPTSEADCARMLSLSLSIKALANAVGKQNVRTVFYEHLSRDVKHTVQELAEWANIPMNEEALASAKQLPGDHATDWLSEGEKATERASAPWCAEYMQLVGYPSKTAIASIAHLPEDERRVSVDYSHLVDPALDPLTLDQQRLLNRFWIGGDAFSWIQAQTPVHHDSE